MKNPPGSINALCNIMLWGLLTTLLLTGLARWNFLAEIFSHFQLQYAMAAILLLVLLWWCREARWKRLTALMLIAIYSVQVGFILVPRKIETSTAFEDIRILQFNLKFNNPKPAEVAEWIMKLAPDIVVLQEVTPRIASNMKALEKTYPFHLLSPRDGAFGSTIYSRIPVDSQERLPFPNPVSEYSVLQLRTPKNHIPFTLTEVHTYPPAGPKPAARRNAELKHVAQVVSEQKDTHKILMGDLNMTPYSPFFSDLEKESGLTNGMRGVGISGTWPEAYPGILRITIDHVLVSKNIEVMERKVLIDRYSDHLPVLTTHRLYQ